MKTSYDFVIAGAGIIGLAIARALLQQGHKSICVLEKENALGKHASGHNSGVLHAGIYYAQDSLKAQLCSKGSKMLQEYAKEKNIPVDKSGKVIVATSEHTLPQIDVLFDRAQKNKVRVEKIDRQQLKELEPEAFTVEKALFSPDTAVIDSVQVLENLEKDLQAQGVDIEKSSELVAVDPMAKKLVVKGGILEYGHFINAAGLHADRIAHWMNVGLQYRILPFKGIYQKLDESCFSRFKRAIYPAPDLEVPFLGVHVTKGIDGKVMVGPTAIPAFGRENYGMLSGLNLSELPVMVRDLSTMMLQNKSGFRKMVFQELNKYRPKNLLRDVQALAPNIKEGDILPGIGKVGLRAQLVNEKEMKLVMDFLVEKGQDSTHVLNAVSPGFTSSLAFGEKIVADL